MPRLVLEGPMAAGRLRDLITIQVNSLAGTADSRGQEQESWVTFAQGYADLQLVSRGSREIEAAGTRLADVWYDVLSRFIPGVTPKMRVLWGTHLLDIQAVTDPDHRRRRLYMICLERAAAGTIQ